MTTAHPDQRAVPCRVLTPAGFLEATFHVALKSNLVDMLNRGDALFRLTQARLPTTPEPLPFFALERSAAVLVAPQGGHEQPPTPPHGALKNHHTWWLLHGGAVVEGTLTLLHGVRVSDHLLHRTGFVVLKDAVLRVAGKENVALGPWVALQSASAIGASETE